MKAAFPVLMRDYGLAENLEGMWANEQDSPYIETKASTGSVGYHVGGRSLMGRQSYRFSDLTSKPTSDGIATDRRSAMPTSRRGTTMWKFAGIAGTRANWTCSRTAVPAADPIEHRRRT